ncbi:MAG: 50S ribosomal protein L5 [Chlamydiales bacterium]|nr:50S ribosomal protein L5 [Chlamydiales bacterium]MCH9635780.1 50S ribosomal protein L5 [Chlamydiales bacterium]MCH9704308.1 50S ribosomal protein L5 [Chlamydiota bacterium]
MGKLKEKYQSEVKKKLQEKFKYKNVMQLPKMVKVVINMGLAEASKDKNVLQAVINELTLLSGQKPKLNKARKSVAAFKLREGQVIGAKVTLRGQRMFDFMERFFNIVTPRIRDFRGFEDKCDGRGCYSVGIDDQQVFPEINLDLVKKTQGMQFTFVTTAETDDECRELLRSLGMPFKRTAEAA